MAIEKMVKQWFKILFECKKYVGKNSIYQLPHLKSRMNGVGQRFGFSFPSLHGVRSAIRASRAPKINWDVGGGIGSSGFIRTCYIRSPPPINVAPRRFHSSYDRARAPLSDPRLNRGDSEVLIHNA